MTCSLIGPVIAFTALAQTTPDSSSGSQRTSLEQFALVLVGLILFVALTGLLALLGRRASEPTHAHRHRRPFVPTGWGLDRGEDPDAAAADSVPRPPARSVAGLMDEVSSTERRALPRLMGDAPAPGTARAPRGGA
jgi:hypothetical protein